MYLYLVAMQILTEKGRDRHFYCIRGQGHVTILEFQNALGKVKFECCLWKDIRISFGTIPNDKVLLLIQIIILFTDRNMA